MSGVFTIEQGGLQDRFLRSTAKVQIYGGGFANGKTSAACMKALQLARDYPGSNGLIARETRPKLADTIMKEFVKWCPKKWIKSFPRGQNSSNTCTLTNGTEINFRYIAQQKKGEAEGTSNLLSATYDWIIVDQMEDPGIVEKDFDDLLGRLRGNAVYRGNDPNMPPTGPRWFIITLNPTRNWIFRKLVQPLQLYQQKGLISPDLLCVRDRDSGEPILDEDGKPQLLIELFEGSTYENERNLGEDFIVLLESRYQGTMKERFLLGQWAAYSGLVYSQYDTTQHSVPIDSIHDYMDVLLRRRVVLNWLEGYDYGLAVPSCYGLAFVDDQENVILVDGFYQAEMLISDQIAEIKKIRNRYGVPTRNMPFADPQIFRRGPGGKDVVGKTVADEFGSEDIYMTRGNNNIRNGIMKVQAHLNPYRMHRNPFNHTYNSPHFYHAEHLDWIDDEMNEYVWNTDSKGALDGDKPVDRNDHALDMIKYMLSVRPEPSVVPVGHGQTPWYLRWHEVEDQPPDSKPHRH